MFRLLAGGDESWEESRIHVLITERDSSVGGAIRFLHSAQTRKLLLPGCIISPASCAECIRNRLLNNQLHVLNSFHSSF